MQKFDRRTDGLVFFSKPFPPAVFELELEHREEMSRSLARLLQGDHNFHLPLNLSTLYQSIPVYTSPLVHVSDPTIEEHRNERQNERP